MASSPNIFLAANMASNSETEFRAMSDASPLGILMSDPKGNCIYTNAAYQRISGQTFAETLGINWSRAIHPSDRQRTLLAWGNTVRTQVPFVEDVRFVNKSNGLIWTSLNTAIIPAKNNRHRIQGYVQIVENISDLKTLQVSLHAVEDALFEQQESARTTLNSIGDGVLTITLAGNVNYLNHKAELMTGWLLRDAIGLPLAKVFKVIDATTRKLALSPLKRALKENQTTKLATNELLIHRAGTEAPLEYSIAPIHNREQNVTGAVIVFHDASKARAHTEKMIHLAQHDVLTGLPNRVLLNEHLNRALGIAKRHQKQVALLFLDVDNFKQVNDSLGHLVGDKLLQSVARRLAKLVRITDTLCRQGGDEFVMLLTEIEHSEAAAQVAKKLIAAISAPHLIDGHRLEVTLSIGISIYPDDCSNPDTMFKHADAAMYHVKTCGRNNYQFFLNELETYETARSNRAL